MPYEMVRWEQLYWFLKFLIPKLIVKDPDGDIIDEILNSVDLSTYGLQRFKLNESIGLDDSPTTIDPQNPNPRGAHDGDKKVDVLEEIVKEFNLRWFQGWDVTPEDQKFKFITLLKQIKSHEDYKPKFLENKDEQNRDLAFKKILDDIMRKQRKNELEFYKLYAQDDAFSQSSIDTMKRLSGDRNMRI